MILLEGCAFCADNPGYDLGVDKRTIWETEHIRVFPTVGQFSHGDITGGYLLLAPKEHYITFGGIPEGWYDETIQLMGLVDAQLTKEYAKPIFLEHGGLGQTIYHAHIHAIPFPKNVDIFDVYLKDFPNYERITSIRDLKRIWNSRGHYLYYEINGHKFVFSTNIPPMYGRIVTAGALGIPDQSNWRTADRSMDEMLIRTTIDRLKGPDITTPDAPASV